MPLVLDGKRLERALHPLRRLPIDVGGERAAAGRTVIAISHDIRFVAETFRRVAVMRNGRVVLDGTPDEVFAEASWPILASTFLEPPLAARVGARLGLGRTPTEAALVSALMAAARGGRP